MKQVIKESSNAFLIIMGILSAGMGLHGFLASSNFIDGGITGVCMLLAKITGFPLSLLIPLINFPFIILGYRQLGPAFAVRSSLAIIGLSLALSLIHYPDVTPDRLLTAVFGGFFIGAGIGFAVRGGAVLDGTEIAALLISKKSSLVRLGDVILIFNIVLFLTAIAVLGVESALYSILTYFTAARTLDFIIHGIDEYTAVTIISEKNALIRAAITNDLNRSVTIFAGWGGVSGDQKEIIYCVITRLEISKIKTIVRELDPQAFLVVQSLADVMGGTLPRSIAH